MAGEVKVREHRPGLLRLGLNAGPVCDDSTTEGKSELCLYLILHFKLIHCHSFIKMLLLCSKFLPCFIFV